MTDEECVADEKTVDAVRRNVEVLGAAATNGPEAHRQASDDVPWSEMAGMRAKLIHGYTSIDLQIVWATADEELPALIPGIDAVRDDLEQQ